MSGTNSLKRKREYDPPPDPPRKRPGNTARIPAASVQAIKKRQEQRQTPLALGIENVVREHYNAVPQRGREWRRTDSMIKGLRSYNNWVKTVLISKFSGNQTVDAIKVLDVGCGKGGDLGKWAQAPQRVSHYVGVDGAEVSIEQARGRYEQMRPGRGGRGGYHGGGSNNHSTYDAAFINDDAFANSLGDHPIIQQLGFGGASKCGPGSGFDVVSMMFSMHYAFESNVKAQGMLQNVALSLKKGGRFIGVIPNSDVISSAITDFYKPATPKPSESTIEANQPTTSSSPTPPKTSTTAVQSDPSTKPSNPDSTIHSNDSEPPQTPTPAIPPDSSTKPSDPDPTTNASNPGPPNPSPTTTIHPDPSTKPSDSDQTAQTAEWGNSIYRVRFPSAPRDGKFRPAYGWKYSFFLEEAVEEVPEYVVPWEAFRGLAEDHGLELQYRKTFGEMWEEEGNSREFGPLSERMGVRERDGGGLRVSGEEMEAARFYHAFCFYKV